MERPNGRGASLLWLLLSCLVLAVSSDWPGGASLEFSGSGGSKANGVCTFECIEDMLQNEKLVNLIVTMSTKKLDVTHIEEYEDLIPDEIKVFLRDETQTKQLLQSLDVTIKHAAQDMTTRTTLSTAVVTERPRPEPEDIDVEEINEISSELVNGELEFPVVVNSDGEMTVTIHEHTYKIPQDIEKIKLDNTTELKRLFMELTVLGFPVTQTSSNRISWSSTKTSTTRVSISTKTTSSGKEIVTINGNSFSLPAENQLLVKFIAEQPSMTFDLLEKFMSLNLQLDINKLASTKPTTQRTQTTAIRKEMSTSSTHTSSVHSTSSITPLPYTEMPIKVVDGSIEITVEGQQFRFPEDLPQMSEELTEHQLEVVYVTARDEGFPVRFKDQKIVFDSEVADRGPSVKIDSSTVTSSTVTVMINQERITLPTEKDLLKKYIKKDQRIIYHLLETFKESGMQLDLSTLDIAFPRPRPTIMMTTSTTTQAPRRVSSTENLIGAEDYPLTVSGEAANYDDEVNEHQLTDSSYESDSTEVQPALQSTRDGRVVVIFKGQRFSVPNDLTRIHNVLDDEQITRLVASLSILGVPVEMQGGKVIVTQKPPIPSISVQQIPGNKILVHVDQSTYTLPQEANRLRLLWQQHPEYIYTIVVGYPRYVIGTPLLWNNYLTDHVLLTQELARTHYQLTVPSRDVTTLIEHIPSYELLTTTDGQLVIRVQGQTLQVPDDLPQLQTLVSPSMLMTIVTRLQQIGIPVRISNNRVIVTRESSTSYRIEVEVRTRGDRLISIVINMNGQRFELPRDADKFQKVIRTEPEVTFQLFKLLAKYHIPVEFDQRSGTISFTFSDSGSYSEVEETKSEVPYTITSEEGKLIIRIADEAFEIPRDIQRLTSILDHEQLVTIVTELKSFGAPIELRGSRLVITREQTTSYRISLQVTTMRGQPIKAIVTINQDRYQLPADEDRFQAFLAKEPSINYKIFQLLSSKNIPISYDNETRRVRIKFATPAQIQQQSRQSQRIVSSGSRTSSSSKSMSASVVYGQNNHNLMQG